jgi:hypothetical protein
MSNLYRAPSINASYQVLDHLAKGFQMRRLKCEKSMENRRLMDIKNIKSEKMVLLLDKQNGSSTY